MADWNLFHAFRDDEPEEHRWRTYTDTTTYDQHVIPLRDTMHHDMSGECNCDPRKSTSERGDRYLHQAKDGRRSPDSEA